jgi:hypothetical protein
VNWDSDGRWKPDLSDHYWESELCPEPVEAVESQEGAEPKQRPPSQASVLVGLAASVELFHTDGHEPFAVIAENGHREVWSLKDGSFRRWLQRLYYEETGRVASAQAVQDTLGVLQGKALFDGPKRSVHVRLAQDTRAVYLDLGDGEWQAVTITAEGWKVVSDPPVWFRRPNGLQALPIPEPGGHLADLRRFVNVTESDWPLLIAFLVFCLHPAGPYPVLVIHGEQGSAKTTVARAIRALVDPRATTERAEPRSPHDLAIAAQNGWLLIFDNLSTLRPWLSDGFCRLATGGGVAARELYTDASEVLFNARRPLVLTGIGELATRGDLLDRSVLLTLPRISDERRQEEEEFWRDFEAARPRLLGALLDAFSAALRYLPEVKPARPPRMADFARFAVAAEPALGLSAGAFLAAYQSNRAEAHESALDSSLIAAPVSAVAAEGFEGTATELLAALAGRAGETAGRRGWPTDASRLSLELRRLAPNLREIGIEVEFDFKLPASRRGIAIRTATETSVPTVPTVPDPPAELAAQDAPDGWDALSHDFSDALFRDNPPNSPRSAPEA